MERPRREEVTANWDVDSYLGEGGAGGKDSELLEMERAINLSLQDSGQKPSRGVVFRERVESDGRSVIDDGGEFRGKGKNPMSAQEVARAELAAIRRVEGNYVGESIRLPMPIVEKEEVGKDSGQMDVENLVISVGGQQLDLSDLRVRGPLFNQALQESLSRLLLEDGKIMEDILQSLDRSNTEMLLDQAEVCLKGVENERKHLRDGGLTRTGSEEEEEDGTGPKIDALQEEESGGEEEREAEKGMILAEEDDGGLSQCLS